ncbi:hypothetical protein [Streptomyces chartreusis]|uniref:hypothetical protein n=1 Tax=Streptomyces chartreusis TaxID=1969 RepID=UPI00123D1015|nr:hypothetical protein [Streptomyces chartreusis]QEV66210.1 hypothetical protein CP983_05730 [Streptomyces chartreusis]GGW98678.1 hypothetical protein GCM10010321_11340 [Streptomyces chartreusis]
MRLLRERFGRTDLSEPVWDRIAEVSWVLDHEDDLDADFLAIYRIDLEQVDISARRYFALAHRLTAYQGVMAARVEAERERREPARSTTPTRSSSPAPAERGDVTELSLTQLRAKFPGVVSVGQGG